jgi:hypothetical protein
MAYLQRFRLNLMIPWPCTEMQLTRAVEIGYVCVNRLYQNKI